MKTTEVQQLLQHYFKGESTEAEEKQLHTYFEGDNIAAELAEYAEFFGGLSEITEEGNDAAIEEDVMNYILENEHREKTKYRSMWKTVTGIAASVIIALGGFLFYQEQQKPFEDSFDNPEEAYAYASKTLSFVSGKYNKGLAQFAQFDKLRKVKSPVQKGTAPVVEFYKGVEKMRQPQPAITGETDSL